jgi:hypothetical protein
MTADDRAEIAELEAAIRANQATSAYQAAREDWQRRKLKGTVGEHTARLEDEQGKGLGERMLF